VTFGGAAFSAEIAANGAQGLAAVLYPSQGNWGKATFAGLNTLGGVGISKALERAAAKHAPTYAKRFAVQSGAMGQVMNRLFTCN
jgi:hypothetical protein